MSDSPNMQTANLEQWLEAREALLEKEKAYTKMRDELSAQRQALPMLKVDKEYVFKTEQGDKSLPELFKERSQLLMYHFMYGDGWQATCIGCTQWAMSIDGTTQNYGNADARFLVVSNAPLEQLLEEKARRGWKFDWVSCFGTDFGMDFYSSAETPDVKSKQFGSQEVSFDRGENHGITSFYKDESDQVYLTYSCYNRGVEPMNGSFAYYDILKKGRQW